MGSCVQSSNILRVLDHHLNASPGGEEAWVNDIQWESLSPPTFGFDLLNTFDWLSQNKS